MKSTLRSVLAVMIAASLAFVSAWSSEGPQTPQVKKIEAPARAVTPALLKKLTAPTSREVILESIKTLQRPAAPLAQAARPAAPPMKMQLRQGPGKGKPAASTSAAGAAPSAVMSTGYDKIDWKAGVLISPFTVPKYGNANWPAAMVRTEYVSTMKTQDPGLVVFDYPITYENSYTIFNAVSIWLELPQEPGLYTITLKAARVDGVCDARWVGLRTKCGSYALTAHFAGQDVPLTKLLDDSGFVGIVNIAPGEAREGSSIGMRQYNATLSVTISTWADSQNDPVPQVAPLAFAGIIITRL